MNEIRLTKTVAKGGCAAKVEAAELRKILANIRFPAPHPELQVDGRHFDDAAIYRVSDSVAMVQTLDFFTPIVDTPTLFGRVAAANALSDVYAMGGRPKTCMAVLAFPLMTIDNETITQVLQGACDTISEAGANFVGGHSIDDDTLKFGLSVTGFVHPEKVWTNAGAKPGDLLILTKALGTGTLSAALKREAVTESDIEDALHSMSQLNNVIDYLPESLCSAIHAATDVTGFGLSGHGMQLAKASGVTLEIQAERLPTFDKVKAFLREYLTKAHRTNREYTAAEIDQAPTDWRQTLIHDPQTSGGLLLSVEASQAEQIIEHLKSQFPYASIIGEVRERSEKSLTFR